MLFLTGQKQHGATSECVTDQKQYDAHPFHWITIFPYREDTEPIIVYLMKYAHNFKALFCYVYVISSTQKM